MRPALPGEMPKLVTYPDAASNIGRDCCTRDTHFGKGPRPYETRTEQDVQGIRQPQGTHGDDRVACPAENRADGEKSGRR